MTEEELQKYQEKVSKGTYIKREIERLRNITKELESEKSLLYLENGDNDIYLPDEIMTDVKEYAQALLEVRITRLEKSFSEI